MAEVAVSSSRGDGVGGAAAAQRAAIESLLKSNERQGLFPAPAKGTAGAELASVRSINEHKDAVTEVLLALAAQWSDDRVPVSSVPRAPC